MAIKELAESWWAKMSPEQRKAYLAKHPKSGRAHTQVKPGVAQSGTETATSNALDIVKKAGLRITSETKKDAMGTWYRRVHILKIADSYDAARPKLIAKFGNPSASTIGDTRWNMTGFKVYLREISDGTTVSVYVTL